MTWKTNLEESVKVKSEMASLYRARLLAEQQVCPRCGEKAEVSILNGRITYATCCEEFRQELEELSLFTR